MSVKERESEQEKVVWPQREAELPNALVQTAVLLEELRDRGVLTMIKEVTKEEIWSLRPIHSGWAWVHPRGSFPRLVLSTKEISQRKLNVDVQCPSFSDSGAWDQTLRIAVMENTNRPGFEGEVLRPNTVIISYDVRGKIAVKGSEVTFHGSLLKRGGSLDTLERAFTQALDNPKRPEPIGAKPRDWHDVPINN